MLPPAASVCVSWAMVKLKEESPVTGEPLESVTVKVMVGLIGAPAGMLTAVIRARLRDMAGVAAALCMVVVSASWPAPWQSTQVAAVRAWGPGEPGSPATPASPTGPAGPWGPSLPAGPAHANARERPTTTTAKGVRATDITASENMAFLPPSQQSPYRSCFSRIRAFAHKQRAELAGAGSASVQSLPPGDAQNARRPEPQGHPPRLRMSASRR